MTAWKGFNLLWCVAFLAYDVAMYVDTGRGLFLGCAVVMAALFVMWLVVFD